MKNLCLVLTEGSSLLLNCFSSESRSNGVLSKLHELLLQNQVSKRETRGKKIKKIRNREYASHCLLIFIFGGKYELNSEKSISGITFYCVYKR